MEKTMKYRFFIFCIFVLLALGSVASLAQTPPPPQPTPPPPSPTRTPIPSGYRTPTPPRQKTGKESGTTAKTTERFSSSMKKSAVPSKGRTSKGKSLSYVGTYEVPQFNAQADKNLAILYFYPSDRMTIAGGEPFTTLVLLSNPQAQKFDKIFMAIKYDSTVLKPEDYEDKLSPELLKEQPKTLVYDAEGILCYSAELKNPLSVVNDEILAIRWKPLVPYTNSPLSFTEFEKRNSGLYMGAVNILGEQGVADDGTIPASITVMPKSFVSEMEVEDEEEFLTNLVTDRMDATLGDGSIHLTLQAPDNAIKQGETFLVHILFQNPNAINIDNVSLDIRFDPDVLKVVDYDDENWITRDVNIFDGTYHEKFPFDYHIKNQAYNQTGRIIYKMGVSKSDALIHEGIVATIKFYALAPVDNGSIKFYLAPSLSDTAGTSITYMGNSVLGKDKDRYAGLLNTQVRVIAK